MKRSTTLWIIAFCLTVAVAVYQRVTGPTHPVKENITFETVKVKCNFDRNHSGEGDQLVKVELSSNDFEGNLYWKRFNTDDEWSVVKMKKGNGTLTAHLPHQPPAGKLVYKINLIGKYSHIDIPEEPVVTRFKGAVPIFFLAPHILFMFVAMLLAIRSGLELFNKEAQLKLLTISTVATLFVGGLILGPIAQKYAFGEFWTGFPFGTDLTDNKTLIAFGGWLIAFWSVFKSWKPKFWVGFATILMFTIFLIPHSVWGSELDYGQLDKKTKQNVQMKESLE